MYTPINLEQNDIKSIHLLRSVSLYCLVRCNTCTRLMTNVGFHVSLNVIIIVLNF